MNKIHIVNWLLTRRCDLKCDYCRIVKNYSNKPKEYPDMKHYYDNEMSTETIISGLKKLKLHNPNVFNIFYGGEPLLRNDLYKIINYCNKNDIHYTIISNNSEVSQRKMKELFIKVSSIEGYTASIDPIIYQNKSGDIFKKSMSGFLKLQEYSSIINDVVAEITVTNENLPYLYSLVKDLTNNGINSDITFVDISKSAYYDFSNVTDDSILVKKSPELRDIINSIIDEKLNVHMRDTLLPKIYDTLPSEYDCKLDENFHNMTIDADGTVRLCLRIRGVATPNNFNINNIIDDNGNLNEYLKDSISYDKKNYCQKCQWSCPIMSEMVSEEVENSNNLIHEEIRNR
jgi:radical SAM protein with 4Fe4S-binding SPASM domain